MYFSIFYKKRLDRFNIICMSLLVAMSTTDAISPDESMKDYLADHPRMIGALFTILLLLSQASTALGAGTTANPGP